MQMHGQSAGFSVIRACWIIFVLVWLLGTVSTKRSLYRESAIGRTRYWLLLVIGCFLVIKSDALPQPFDWVAVQRTALSAWIGVLLCVSGVILAIWARVTLGRNWSGVITLKEDHELIERGPYRIVRHPIYTGILAMFSGTAIALGYVGAFLGLLLLFLSFWLKLQREEDLMLKHFPAQYAAYQCRVKRLIPFLL
jgi:protein-S-isoprenylcysteine O-methyltransferase Ste14